MKKPALLIAFFLFPFMSAYSNSFIPIPVSGFNEDVVAHDTPANQTTSVTFDDYNRVFYVAGFPNGDYGMPEDGIIISEANPARLPISSLIMKATTACT